MRLLVEHILTFLSSELWTKMSCGSPRCSRTSLSVVLVLCWTQLSLGECAATAHSLSRFADFVIATA